MEQNEEMTREEFEKWLISNFFAWTAARPRLRVHWLQSLENFAHQEFDRAYNEAFKQNG